MSDGYEIMVGSGAYDPNSGSYYSAEFLMCPVCKHVGFGPTRTGFEEKDAQALELLHEHIENCGKENNWSNPPGEGTIALWFITDGVNEDGSPILDLNITLKPAKPKQKPTGDYWFINSCVQGYYEIKAVQYKGTEPKWDRLDKVVTAITGPLPIQEQEANAILISSAPDMLKAIRAYVKGDPEADKLLRKAFHQATRTTTTRLSFSEDTTIGDGPPRIDLGKHNEQRYNSQGV